MTLYLLLPPPGEVPDKMTNQKLHFLVNHQHVKLYGFNLFCGKIFQQNSCN